MQRFRTGLALALVFLGIAYVLALGLLAVLTPVLLAVAGSVRAGVF
jgi:hypothetical protein